MSFLLSSVSLFNGCRVFGDGGYLLNLGTYTGAPGSKSRKVTHVRSVFFFCSFSVILFLTF